MRKQSVTFDSPLDALVAIAKRLSRYEAQAGMDSESFFSRYSKGELGDDARSVDWANDYRHFVDLRGQLDKRLHEAA
ncbi:MAG TPA: hypothetical protein VES73_07515 [Lamprocystis sp. (in: g-proteobacteria)]|nr:hypothetical protein [Lamprocystis sp. (in: g-proteobacteria)]